MPSSFTPLLKLELPATGELSGTWGTTVNNAITTPLSEAVAGTTTITVGGSDYTLSNGDGSAANEARKMFIVATGTPGASRNVICPAASKFYVFRNDTNQTLTLKTLSGTGIAVPAGQYRFLYCDGTNVVETFNAMASLTLGTALAAASGGTGQSSYTAGDLLYATGTTALSKLGIGASTTILTSSGTAPQWTAASSVAIGTATNLAGGAAGSVPYQSGAATTTFLGIGAANTVMTSSGTAPQWSTALTGLTGVSTTTATLSGNLTLSGGTANGVLFLNGSKVVTSGSALTFDGANLGVGRVPSYAIDAQSASDAISRLRAAATFGAGFFGTLPNSDTTMFALSDKRLTTGGTAGQVVALYSASLPIAFEIGAEQMRLTGTGLGIGTSSPTSKLTIGTGTYSAAASGTAGLYATVSQGLVVLADGFIVGTRTGADRLILDSSGNLGIGTSSPLAKLDVRGASGNGIQFLETSSGNTTRVQLGTASGIGYINADAGAGSIALGLRVGGAQLALLDASGNLGLGVTPSAWSQGRAIEVAGTGYGIWNGTASIYSIANAYFDSGFKYANTGAQASHYYQFQGQHVWSTAASGTAGNAISFTQAMTLDASGNLGIGTTSAAYKLHVYSSGANLVGSEGTTDASFITRLSGTQALYFHSDALSSEINELRNVPLIFKTNSTERARIPAAGGMVVGTAALATNATDGFLYVPTCAGTPTGTPTTQTGTAPIVVDTTNNKLYFYSGGQWRDAGP